MSLYDIYVPPEGEVSANIMLVGEGPGRHEARQRRPFVGRIGSMVDDLIRSNGLERGTDVFLTNVTKKMPRGKEKDKFFFQKGNPTKIYMEGILELIQEIREVQPNVIGAFGKYSLWALTQRGLSKGDRITNWRGSIMESTLVSGQKVVPMIHPSWFSRGNMHKLPLLDWDFQRVVKESRTPEIILPEAEFIVDPTPEQIRDAVERFTNPSIGLLTIDTEWYSPNSLAYIGFSDSKEHAICIPSTSMLAYRAYKEILDSDIPKVMQNAMFDVVALDRVGITVRNVIHDTMVAFHSCFMDLREKGLNTQASVLTRWPYYKSDVEFVGTDDEKGQEYCCTDCVVTTECIEKLTENEFHIWGGKKGYDISMSIMDTFLEASRFGILLDMDRMEELREHHLQEVDYYQEKVNNFFGYSLNTRSAPQVRRAVYDFLEYGKERKGRSTAQDVLMDIAASDHRQERKDILTWIIRVRQNKNTLSRYINKKIIDRDGRVRCTWNLAGTRNGRLSTTEPWWPGVALQTVPKPPSRARQMFISDPGHVFVGWDLEQAEAYVVAVKARDFDLLEALESSIDIHSLLGEQLGVFNMSYEDFMRQIQEKGKDEVHERYLSKKCRHSLNYYGTWYTLKKSINREYLDTGVGVDAAMSKRLVDAYTEVSPGLEGWWDEVHRTLMNKRYLVNAYGRRRNFFGPITKFEHSHRDGIAFYPQSSVADHTTQTLAEIDRVEWIRPLLHMHDGGMTQVPEDKVEEAIEIISDAANREMIVDGEILEIPVEIKVGYNWLDLVGPEKFVA